VSRNNARRRAESAEDSVMIARAHRDVTDTSGVTSGVVTSWVFP
jgi:hypothetical protein